jgi:hypothetical protein
MKFYLTLLAAALLSTGEPSSPAPSPSPAAAVKKEAHGNLLELYFEKPARIVSWHTGTMTSIVEEVPFLTDADFSSATVGWSRQRGYVVYCWLSPSGLEKLQEASMGNLGRMAVFTLESYGRASFPLPPKPSANTLSFSGQLSAEEAELIAKRINYRPIPTPRPAGSPTPLEDQNTVVF